MTPSERRLHGEVRFWGLTLCALTALIGALVDPGWALRIPGAVAFLMCALLATSEHRRLRRLDAEAKQEEWS